MVVGSRVVVGFVVVACSVVVVVSGVVVVYVAMMLGRFEVALAAIAALKVLAVALNGNWRLTLADMIV